MNLIRAAFFASALGLAACASAPKTEGGEAAPVAEAPPAPVETGRVMANSVAAAVEGEWRTEADRARDQWRHPIATLDFFGVKGQQTVVELAPGAGWYTEILAPHARMNGGLYIAAMGDPAKMSDAGKKAYQDFRDHFSRGDVYGKVDYWVFSKDGDSACVPGTADVVLTFRNVHNWMAGGWAEKAFADMYKCLKPGGTLGVVEHRLPASMMQESGAPTGYVHEEVVKGFAAKAGFEFVEASEINANPKDTADHPFGVWTLPPVKRTAKQGLPADPTFDRAKFDAIGESDRMTLKFRKPG